MLQIVPRDTKIDFIGKWKVTSTLSILLTILSVYIWVSMGEAKYGSDFKGGHDLLVQVSEEVTSDTIRAGLKDAGIEDSVVQAFEKGSNEYSIRLPGGNDPGEVKKVRDSVQGVLAKVSPKQNAVLKTDYVGPTVGKELRTKALIATLLGVIGLLIYISIRFEFAFALAAVVAVFHDVIMTTGFYLYAGHTINMASVAAALTILGYSVNDTIVIFDRVREELSNPRHKDLDLASLFNLCINQTLSRTIITSGLTLLSVAALLLLGGGAIQDLSFFLFVGIILGTYSTVYIASPVVLAWEWWRRRKSAELQTA
ncbi:MAG: protein translocase subunit SecF [Proteobacteria bacterium]|nr:protein translocase subunit SecF [Pseudomonadota bacterium]